MSFLLIIGFIVADVYASVQMGKAVGGWMLLLWFVMAFFVGRSIMRNAAKDITPQLQAAQTGANLEPNKQFFAAIFQSLAGILLILPSVLTDLLAVLLLLPPIQKMLQGGLQKAFAARGNKFVMMGGFGQAGQSPFGGQNPFQTRPSPFEQGDVFEGEATDVTPTSNARISDGRHKEQ